jgi:hypothetical protein
MSLAPGRQRYGCPIPVTIGWAAHFCMAATTASYAVPGRKTTYRRLMRLNASQRQRRRPPRARTAAIGLARGRYGLSVTIQAIGPTLVVTFLFR